MKLQPNYLAEKAVEKIIEGLSDKKNVRSVYAIGGTVKKPKNVPNDIDLNFFIHEDSAKFLWDFSLALKYAEKEISMPIDTNIISDSELRYKDTGIFIHKFRHALFMSELKNFPALLYGEAILDSYVVMEGEIFLESFKLVPMLSYRIKKDMLAKGRDDEKAFRQLKKFTFYGMEFLLASKGIILNPENYRKSHELFLDEFKDAFPPETMEEIFRFMFGIATGIEADEGSFDTYYELLQSCVRLSECRFENLTQALSASSFEEFKILMKKYFFSKTYEKNPDRWQNTLIYLFKGKTWIFPHDL